MNKEFTTQRILFTLTLQLLLAATLCVDSNATSPSDLTVADLIDQTKATESKVKTLSVKMTASNATRRMTKTGLDDAKAGFSESWHIDVSGIGWAEGHGNVWERNRQEAIVVALETSSATFDGKVGNRILRTRIDGKEHTFASMEDRLKGRFSSPLLFVERVSAALEAGGFEIAQTQVWEGREVIVVQKLFPATARENVDRKTEIWIDPALNFAVVKRRQLKRADTSVDWDVEWNRDSSGHQEIADGVWLPAKGTNSLYQSTGSASVETNYTFTDWKINSEIDNEKLHLDFPEGVRIRNRK